MSLTRHSEVADRADFSIIRYALCWEDADILLEALDVQPGETCLSIASAGDNTLSLLTRDPSRVIAIDLSPAQLACLELRVAAYQTLSHDELLELLGVRRSDRRSRLYQRIKRAMSERSRAFWDRRPDDIDRGAGAAGRFENYLRIFRHYVLPLIHSERRRAALFTPRGAKARRDFYASEWDSLRWRWLMTLFCSRAVSSRLARDPSFYRYVEGSVGARVLERARYALTELDPSQNPYLQWIVLGTYQSALPHALRPEHFETIRGNLDRLELRASSLEAFLAEAPRDSIDRFNLSDVFEYMSEPETATLLGKAACAGRAGGRLAYWNMFVPRRSPDAMRDRLRPLVPLADRLHRGDKAFFYSAFVVEEIL